MQNDYLSNKKIFKSLNEVKSIKQNRQNYSNLSPKSKRVDINKLLNRVKLDKKNKKKENILIFSAIFLIVSVFGIICFL